MTIDSAANEVEAMIMPMYLKSQIIDLIKKIQPVVITNTKIKTEYVKQDCNPDINLDKIAQQVERETGVSLEEMRCKRRTKDIVNARCLFVRMVLTKDILYNRCELMAYINKDHSSIYWYAGGKDNSCGIEPLKITRKYEQFYH